MEELKDGDTIQVNRDLTLNGTMTLKNLMNVTIKSTLGQKYTISGGGVGCFSFVYSSGISLFDLRVASCLNNASPFGGAFYLQGADVTASNVDTVSNFAHEGSGWYVWKSKLSYKGGNVTNHRGRAIEVYHQAEVELSDLNFTLNDKDVNWWPQYAYTNSITISRCNVSLTS